VVDNFCHFNRIGFLFGIPSSPDRHSSVKTSEDSPAKLGIWALRPPPASSGPGINPNSEQKGIIRQEGTFRNDILTVSQKVSSRVTPVESGVQDLLKQPDSGFRRNDKLCRIAIFLRVHHFLS
jgi:hypothetical protein